MMDDLGAGRQRQNVIAEGRAVTLTVERQLSAIPPRVRDEDMPRLPPVCASSLRRLWEYLDDELPEAMDLRGHLAECPRCGPLAAFARRLLDSVGAARPAPDDLGVLRARIAAALARGHSPLDSSDG